MQVASKLHVAAETAARSTRGWCDMCARPAVPHTPRISIRANRPPGCLRMVARHVIAARAALPRDASVSRFSCSCKSTTRAIRARPGSSLPIWSQSIVHSAAAREPPRRSRPLLPVAHHGPRCVRPCRCRGVRSQKRMIDAPPVALRPLFDRWRAPKPDFPEACAKADLASPWRPEPKCCIAVAPLSLSAEFSKSSGNYCRSFGVLEHSQASLHCHDSGSFSEDQGAEGETARVHHISRRHGGRLAACRARAAIVAAGGRVHEQRHRQWRQGAAGRFQQRCKRGGLYRGPERHDRIPLGRGA